MVLIYKLRRTCYFCSFLFLLLPIAQGQPRLSEQSKLALTKRNMHDKTFLKVVLTITLQILSDLLNRKATGLLEAGLPGMPSHPQFWTDHLTLSISTIKADYAHHFTNCPLDFSDFPTAMSNTKCRQKFQSGWPLSGLWLMSRINDYLKELEQYITHSRLTNETRLAVTKRAQK